MAAQPYAAIHFFRHDHGIRKMVLRRPLCAIILAAFILLPDAVRAGNPLPVLLGDKPSGSFCFSRVYEAAHLRRHPAQRMTSALASIQYDKASGGAWLRMQLRQKGRARVGNVVAGCEWSAAANRDTAGNRLLAAYRGEEGFACIAIYNKQSAEEAGTVVFTIADDGSAVAVYFDEKIGLWETPGPEPMLKLHREDRAFRLNRANAAECKALEDALRLE
jgi:hypothetical protein